MEQGQVPLRLRSLAGLFLRLGLTAFGGPAAHIAMMEEEVVRRRRWMDHATFLDLLGLCNLLPGPKSTELAIFIGRTLAGWRGLVLAGLCFIVPAALLTLGFAALYVHFGRLPAAQGFLLGIKPVVLAIVAQAVWNLGRSALRTRRNVLLGLGVLAASFLGIQEALLILGAGLLSLLLARPRPEASALGLALLPLPGLPVLAAPFSLGGLFWVFLKVGATLFGSGYVLIAFLRTDLVHHLHWLTETQLLDAVAVGQVTPGPVFTTATFIGFLLGSLAGIVCGIALGRNRMLSDIFSVYIKVLNAIPRVVLAPIFILILGFGLASKVAVAFVMVFFIVFANAFQGVREADRAMIANAQILGASNWQLTRSVIIPSAMSWIFASLHLSFSFAIVGAIVGEFIGSNKGIGHVIQLARGLHDVPLMFAAIIVVLVVVLAAEYLMTLIERRLVRWRPPSASDAHT